MPSQPECGAPDGTGAPDRSPFPQCRHRRTVSRPPSGRSATRIAQFSGRSAHRTRVPWRPPRPTGAGVPTSLSQRTLSATIGPGYRHRIFVKYYVELRHPLAVVQSALLEESPESWIPGLLADGAETERRLLAEVAIEIAHHPLRKKGWITVGPSAPLGVGLVIPVEWRAAWAEHLFPRVEADIQLAPLGAALTQLSINARYEPPLAAFGRLVDRTLLHRVAEAAIRDFTLRVAEHLDARLLRVERR